MARQQVSAEIKAAALADLLAGDQPAIVAQRYGLNRDTVNKWKQRLSTHLSVDMSTDMSTDKCVDTPSETSLVRRPTIEDRQTRIGELIIELLEARLAAQLAIARHVETNDAWIFAQSAADMASLDAHLHRTAVDTLDRLASRRRPEDNSGD
jgi:DNA-binding transcriptional regulator LsrR (DeoR family)